MKITGVVSVRVKTDDPRFVGGNIGNLRIDDMTDQEKVDIAKCLLEQVEDEACEDTVVSAIACLDEFTPYTGD